MSRRVAQIESTLKRAIAEVLIRDISDPRIVGMVSVLRVKVTPDLRQATIYVTVMPEQMEAKTLHGLNHAMPHIHAATRKRMALRQMPRMAFRIDEDYKKQEKLFSAIAQGMQRSGDATTAEADMADQAGVPQRSDSEKSAHPSEPASSDQTT